MLYSGGFMKEVRDFYQEDAEYQKSIIIIKEIIQKIIDINFDTLKEKINFVDNNKKYIDFIDLLTAVIGKKTDKYYYCQNEEDVKYYNMEIGEVYIKDKLNIDEKAKRFEAKILELQARAKLAEVLLDLTKQLEEDFKLNIGQSDGNISTLDSFIIKESDLEYLDNLIKYLQIIIDKTGRLKILISEQDVYSLAKAKEDYNKKNSIEKWFYKTLKKEKDIINSMANKNKQRK